MTQSKASFTDYDGFVEKFKPKRTTDDCYTPQPIYDGVLAYCVERWGIDPDKVVRPFWPGGDYEAFEYPEGCVVVDNPPFSILSKIQTFYLERGIGFFLFAPALTCLSGKRNTMRVDHIVCDLNITYENGAVVRTGFVTNLEPRYVLEADPELGERLNAINDELQRANKRRLPKYTYPDAVLTSARAMWLASHHTPFRVERGECCHITRLDAQGKKGIFGGALLLSERAAAERAAAERAAAYKWELSERELALQGTLGR